MEVDKDALRAVLQSIEKLSSGKEVETINSVKIDTSIIPPIEVKRFCRTFCEAIINSTEDKSFREKFERYISSKEVDSLEKGNIGSSTADCDNSYAACSS